MREIEFRAKRVDNGEWAYGSFINDKKSPRIFDFNQEMFNVVIDIETLGQYTGLKDKNGTKIFEGDIVREQTFGSMTAYYKDEKEFKNHKQFLIKEYDCIFDDEKNYHTNYDYKVEWIENGFYPFADSPENCYHCGGAISNEDVEIIGNIYDNPELMGDKE